MTEEKRSSYVVDENLCIGCAACVSDCAVGAVSMQAHVARIDSSCVCCGDCFAICPVGAVRYECRDITI